MQEWLSKFSAPVEFCLIFSTLFHTFWPGLPARTYFVLNSSQFPSKFNLFVFYMDFKGFLKTLIQVEGVAVAEKSQT